MFENAWQVMSGNLLNIIMKRLYLTSVYKTRRKGVPKNWSVKIWLDMDAGTDILKGLADAGYDSCRSWPVSSVSNRSL